MKRMRAWFSGFKTTQKCACGESDPAAIDFHHVDPATKQDINQLVRSGTIARVAEELKKCLAICANCHRKGHAGRPRKEHAAFFPAQQEPQGGA